MRKLLRYLKPFWWIVILIVGLTFAQVQTELSLPDYMSNIVTNGIQYGGVENATPLVVEKTTMDHYLIFMDDSVKEEVLSHYELLNSGQEAVVGGQSVVFKVTLHVTDANDSASATLAFALQLVNVEAAA